MEEMLDVSDAGAAAGEGGSVAVDVTPELPGWQEAARRAHDLAERFAAAYGEAVSRDRCPVTEQVASLARIEEALAVLVDRHRADQLHSPAIRALAAQRNQLTRLAIVVGDYLDGKASREALAWTLQDVVGQ